MPVREMLGEVRRIGLKPLLAGSLGIGARAALFVFIVYAPYRHVNGAAVLHPQTAIMVLQVAAVVTVIVTLITLYGSATGASWYTRAEAQRVQMEGPQEVED